MLIYRLTRTTGCSGVDHDEPDQHPPPGPGSATATTTESSGTTVRAEGAPDCSSAKSLFSVSNLSDETVHIEGFSVDWPKVDDPTLGLGELVPASSTTVRRYSELGYLLDARFNEQDESAAGMAEYPLALRPHERIYVVATLNYEFHLEGERILISDKNMLLAILQPIAGLHVVDEGTFACVSPLQKHDVTVHTSGGDVETVVEMVILVVGCQAQWSDETQEYLKIAIEGIKRESEER